ncbi:MAG: choice-of-anchor D domain-containing protein [Cellulomonas sp.]|nr:choice-of-anchor D domain-containing protein [Cellulomonas sp.]
MRRTAQVWILAAAAAVGCGGGPPQGTPGENAAAPADASAADAEPAHTGLSAPSAQAFGRVVVGTEPTATLVITNRDATRAAPIDAIEVSGDAFAVDRSACPATLPAAGSCNLVITFAPHVLGASTGVLTVRSLGATTVTSLTGVGAWRLAVAATSTGTITSTPAGIDCGTACSGIFVDGVTLTFAPVPGQGDVAWSVPGCSGLTCEIPATAQGVSATVEALPPPEVQEVIVTRAGTTRGSITSMPAAISCGTTCSGFFTVPVTLTAVPAPGSTFGGWSDPSCGANATCLLPAATGTTTIVATFDALPPRTINVVVSGPAPGEVIAFQADAVVGRCQGSCTMVVPAVRETIVGVETPYDYSSLELTGLGPCNGDRCLLGAGSTEVTVATTFSYAEKDDWTYFGEPGEQFTTGAFDIANQLIASSQLRMMKLDGTGQVLWTRPPADRILAGPGTEFYTWTAAGGTVKRSSDGAAVWTVPGELEAVDRATGNILVHPSSTTMALLLPTGVPLWTMPGQGTDLDSAGIVYEPYTYRQQNPSTLDTEGFLTARRYSATGVPIGELPNICISSYFIDALESDFEVSGDRFACELSGETDLGSSIDFAAYSTPGPPATLTFARTRETYTLFHTLLSAASNGTLGMLHSSIYYDGDFGFWLTRVARDGAQWTLKRLGPAARYPEGHGVRPLGLAGGATDRFAVLGWHHPIASRDFESQLITYAGPDRGIIQAFKP